MTAAEQLTALGKRVAKLEAMLHSDGTVTKLWARRSVRCAWGSRSASTSSAKVTTPIGTPDHALLRGLEPNDAL